MQRKLWISQGKSWKSEISQDGRYKKNSFMLHEATNSQQKHLLDGKIHFSGYKEEDLDMTLL